MLRWIKDGRTLHEEIVQIGKLDGRRCVILEAWYCFDGKEDAFKVEVYFD